MKKFILVFLFTLMTFVANAKEKEISTKSNIDSCAGYAAAAIASEVLNYGPMWPGEMIEGYLWYYNLCEAVGGSDYELLEPVFV